MLRKLLPLAVAACVATLLLSADALAWGGGSWSHSGSGSYGGGSWNRSGSTSYTGRYGNTYSRNYSSSGGYHYGGGYGGYHYGGGYYGGGGGYYGGGFHPGGFLAGYASGVYNSQQY
jgi:hypothetical protein